MLFRNPAMTNATPLKLDPATTALVLIDLQQGILPYAKAPYDAPPCWPRRRRWRGVPRGEVAGGAGEGGILRRRRRRAQGHRRCPEPAGARRQLAGRHPELPPQPGDIHILKRQWGAFHGTELDLQLRRRGIKTIVLAGIATSIGVESTARFAWELGYDIVFAEDATSGPMPRCMRTRSRRCSRASAACARRGSQRAVRRREAAPGQP